MQRPSFSFATRCLLALACMAPSVSPTLAGEAPGAWNQWRGPLGTGSAPKADPLVTWSEERNVAWKVELPGRGHGSPVVWGDRIFLTTAIPIGEATVEVEGQDHVHADGAHDNMSASHTLRYVVLAVDRTTGKTLWSRTVHEGRPHDSTHQSGSWASASAATDGEVVIAFFGSAGLYALTTDGKPLWSKQLGRMQVKHGHGEGSSPALHGRFVVVNWDHEGDSFIAAFDKQDGKELWRAPRDEATSWSSPLVVEQDGRAQVVVAATRRVRGYDLASGTLLWECGGLSGNVVASPVSAGGLVHVGSSYEKRAMLTIRLDKAKGDITGTDAVVWSRDRDTPYVPSLLLTDGDLCFLKHYQGILTCVDAATGTPRFGPQRLPGIGNIYASPVAAAGRIYVTDQDGTTLVLRRGPEGLEVLARNVLDDRFAASAAIDGDGLILRGERFLYRLAGDSPRPSQDRSPSE